MRVVLDTNVLLSALFTRGVCEAVLDACIEGAGVEMVVSEYILGEFRTNAIQKFGASEEEAKEAVAFLRRGAIVVEPAALPASTFKDADDVPVVGTAVAGQAKVLITGDAALLAAKKLAEVDIISPRTFYDALRRSQA